MANLPRTFWQLINQYHISIPKIQRDYAYGRENNKAVQEIRVSLIDKIYTSLTSENNNEPIELNFIYGETSDGVFIPIDGQQRLTTLYLLHWFVFQKNKNANHLSVLKSFSYETRDTSSRFCQRICETIFDTNAPKLSLAIKNMSWFTGSFESDQTIQSMLVVIDCLQTVFQSVLAWSILVDRLIGESCPITFLWLNLDKFQKTEDLYIKMNARGKLLTDFEIFKAKLQKSNVIVDLLEEDNEKSRIKFISKFNNRYSELFYQIFDHKPEYDKYLMDLIKEMIRNEYFCYVSKSGVSQNDYRLHYSEISQMTGNSFFIFVEKGKSYKNCPYSKKVISDGISKIVTVLDIFYNNKPENITHVSLPKKYFSEFELIKKIHENTYTDSIIRFAIFGYWVLFGYPTTDEDTLTYVNWKRFVFNIVNNSDFGGRAADTCEAFVMFSNILGKIASNGKNHLPDVIAGLTENDATAATRYSIKEEIIKAKLMLTNEKWHASIIDAESYFEDGQIGFLLDYAYDDCAKEYNYDAFNNYYNVSKLILSETKRVHPKVDWKLIERALLCMPDKTASKTSFLIKQSNSSTCWGFLKGNYKQLLDNSFDRVKRSIFGKLLNSISCDIPVEQSLKNIIENYVCTSNMEKWKEPFIKQNLFDCNLGYYRFSDCLHLSDNNTCVLMLTGTTVRAYSIELYTFLLFDRMKRSGIKNIDLVLSTTAELFDETKFPSRHISSGSKMIAYLQGTNGSKMIIKDSSLNTVEEKTFDEILSSGF